MPLDQVGPPENATSPCATCDGPIVEPAVVRLESHGKWSLVKPPVLTVHLVALFRDPCIRRRRGVKVVLDLHESDGHLIAGRRCWVRKFVDALCGLPSGLIVALDNGVRCDCPTKLGIAEYQRRAVACHARTAEWFSRLQHPHGGKPGIVICNRDLAHALAKFHLITRRDGASWSVSKRFVDSVGDEIAYLDTTAVVLAHPMNVLYRPCYEPAIQASLPKLIALAGTVP